jgi:hypothetical protein
VAVLEVQRMGLSSLGVAYVLVTAQLKRKE